MGILAGSRADPTPRSACSLEALTASGQLLRQILDRAAGRSSVLGSLVRFVGRKDSARAGLTRYPHQQGEVGNLVRA